jgi:hypothetical protein
VLAETDYPIRVAIARGVHSYVPVLKQASVLECGGSTPLWLCLSFQRAISHGGSFRVNALCFEEGRTAAKESSVKPEHSKGQFA